MKPKEPLSAGDEAAAASSPSPDPAQPPVSPGPPASPDAAPPRPGEHLAALGTAALLLGLLAWLTAPSLRWLAASWRADEDYGHGPLLLAAAALLAWRRWRSTAVDAEIHQDPPPAAPGRAAALGLGLLALAALAQLAGQRLGSAPLAAAGLAAALPGLAALLSGRRAWLSLRYPAFLYLLAIPLPLVDRWGTPLAARVAEAVAALAQALGIPVVLRGAQLTVGAEAFVVGAPCSGLRSLVAAVGLAAVLGGLLRLSPARLGLLLALALPAAVLGNGLRLLVLLLVAQGLGRDAALALFHGPLGAGAFLLTALVLVLLALRWEGRAGVQAPPTGASSHA